MGCTQCKPQLLTAQAQALPNPNNAKAEEGKPLSFYLNISELLI
jgi:hypothetical protein